MRDRCTNQSNSDWASYGGRGIAVCERWATFPNFIEDMHATYAPGLTIERIDNEGPYSPEHCRWATRAEQARNQRRSLRLTHDGRTMIAAEWAREVGINYQTLVDRLNRGWSTEKALTTPVG